LISDYHLNDGETGTQVIATLREILGVSLKAVLTTGDTPSAIKQLPRDPYLRITSKPIKVRGVVGVAPSVACRVNATESPSVLSSSHPSTSQPCVGISLWI